MSEVLSELQFERPALTVGRGKCILLVVRGADFPPDRWKAIRRFEEDLQNLRRQAWVHRLVIPLLLLAGVADVFSPGRHFAKIALFAAALAATIGHRRRKDLSCVHCGSALELPRRGFPPVRFCLYCGKPLSLAAPDPLPIPPREVLRRHARVLRIQKAAALAVVLSGAVLILTGRAFQKNVDVSTGRVLTLFGIALLVPGLWFFSRRRCPTCGEWISTVIRDPADYCYRCGAPFRPSSPERASPTGQPARRDPLNRIPNGNVHRFRDASQASSASARISARSLT